MAVYAVEHIRRMPGGSQSHLMRCSDNNFYVVKCQHNPQGSRILANDFFGTRLAELLGLPVPATSIVELDAWLIEHEQKLSFQLAHGTEKCVPGSQFGSRYIGDPRHDYVLEHLPTRLLRHVRNLHAFAGVLAFDRWTANSDGRQVAFLRKGTALAFTAYFIDQGYCFNRDKWSLENENFLGLYGLNEAYANVEGWESFEPWLFRIENFPITQIWKLATEIPPEWYDRQSGELEKLVEALYARRSIVRDLITALRLPARRLLPMWTGNSTCAFSAKSGA
ncbi:MAG: HipA family kinase [Acidobacteriota bacterium]